MTDWMGVLSFEELYTAYLPHDIRHKPYTIHGTGGGAGAGRWESECVILAVCRLEAMATNERSSLNLSIGIGYRTDSFLSFPLVLFFCF